MLCLLAGWIPLAAQVGVGALYPHPIEVVGTDPVDLVATDLDGDGRIDLAVAISGENEVAVLSGNGDGTFLDDVRHPVGEKPGWMAAGDLDGDGHRDLVVANLDGSDLSVLIGHGDGTFDPEARYGSPGGGLAWFVAFGDFNEDELQDVMLAQSGGNVLFPGNGDGTLGAEIPAPGASRTLAVADVDGDGFDDLVLPGAVFLGNGEFSFTAGQSFPVGTYVTHVETADLDGDDVLDLLHAERDPDAVSVLLGHGDGTFDPAEVHSVAFGGAASRVLVQDRNGDGWPDLVVSHGPFGGGISLLRGTGGGSFAPAEWIDTGSAGAYSIAGGDFDGDGYLDVARGTYGGDDVGVVLGRADGGFVTALPVPVGASPTAVAVADLDGDGRADLVTPNLGSADVSVVLASGAGTFAGETRQEPGAACGVAIADLTGGGIPDLAVTRQASNDLVVLTGNGAGSFTALPPVPLAMSPCAVEAGFVNGDEHADLVVSNQNSSRLSVLLGLGDGTFLPQLLVGVGSGPRGLALGDLDGDAILDVVVAVHDEQVAAVRLGAGDGTFAAAAPVAAGLFPQDVALGDLDGDTVLDLAIANHSSVQVSLGNGDGTFTPAAAPEGGVGYPVTLADVDGDSRLDLVLGSMRIHRGNGDGTFQAPQDFADGGTATGDFDLDGRLDLAGAHSDHAVVTLNQSGPTLLRFLADHVTLEWPSALGAWTYNVYRGALAGLLDADSNGLPDGGYGTCISALDDDTRDTHLVDPSLPDPGDGFFYLRSIVDAQGESDLGTTSAGLPRQPLAPCP
jgi:hypothetical protein